MFSYCLGLSGKNFAEEQVIPLNQKPLLSGENFHRADFLSDLFVFAITQQFPGSKTLEKPVSTLQAEKVKIWTADLLAICDSKV